MSMFSAAIKMCDDCDRNDVPLSWSRDGYTKICADCKVKRGAREEGSPSARALDSADLERAVLATKPQ